MLFETLYAGPAGQGSRTFAIELMPLSGVLVNSVIVAPP